MEKERLEWIKEHKNEIRYFSKNKNNKELKMKYKEEIKQINTIVSELKDELQEKRKEFENKILKNQLYLENKNISKCYSHIDRNAIEYISVYEFKKYKMKIDVSIGMCGWSINLRTLENIVDSMTVKDNILAILKNNNISILQNPQTPYTDEFHINIYEYEFNVPIEEVEKGFCNLLKIFE